MLGLNKNVYPGERVITITNLEHTGLTEKSICEKIQNLLWQSRIKADEIECQVRTEDDIVKTAVAKLAFAE